MKWFWLAMAIIIALGVWSPAFAETRPSPDRPVGWRGDGTGRYPDATPPLHWARVAKSVLSLRAQARKPGNNAPGGEPLTNGVISRWLVLGPAPAPDGAKPKEMNGDTIPDEAILSPDEGQKAGPLSWQPLKTDGALIDFHALFGNETNAIAYAHTYLFSPIDQSVVMQCNSHHSLRLRLNGKLVSQADESFGMRLELPLTNGWNRLLFKVGAGITPGPPNDSWFIDPVFYGGPKAEYEAENIRWVRRMPGTSPAAPIVVGSLLFMVAEPDLLVCVNKDDGRILWVRASTLYDAVSEAERKANPAFAEIEPLAVRIRDIDQGLANAEPEDALLDERDKLQKDMNARLRKIDVKYDTGLSDVGVAGTTPTSDGENVYVWFTSCVSACYDLKGNRRWIRVDNYRNFEHGFTSSPLLVDGKLICYMRDIVAIDAKTGATAWIAKCTPVDPKEVYPSPRFHGSFVVASIGNEKVFVTPEAGIFRVSDGKSLFLDPGLSVNQQIPSAVVQDGVLYRQDMDGLEWPPRNRGGFLRVAELPATFSDPLPIAGVKKVQADLGGYPRYYNNWFMSSPLVHEGLVYGLTCQGVLVVYDPAGAKVVYQKWLNLNQFEAGMDGYARGIGASLTLAGKYIFITGNFGTTLVIKPGRTYEQVACNRTESWVFVRGAGWLNHIEKTVSCPVFDGNRLYYRGEATLYCITENDK